ncbi:unnamed protein product [Clonostachys rhizophaga]|uniref:Uncharacterized protein n=1 Tax=Clonostachys rhizophaga TaxID=160324 RepID=A0A9N9VC77_9HYPO|nr:unnamed protein product [Clonostachys rhizophaga]
MSPNNSAFHDGLVDEIEHAISKIETTPKSEKEVSANIPSTYLPVQATQNDNKDAIRLVKSVSLPVSQLLDSPAERNLLATAWALVLHLYVVSDTVAFVVIDSQDGLVLSEQLVVSHWSASSSELPRLKFGPFIASKHSSKANTAIQFGHGRGTTKWNSFDYILHSPGRGSKDLSFHTRQISVPRKFASAIWSTFIEINSQVRAAGPLGLAKKYQISEVDKRAIRSFLPDPIYEAPRSLHENFEHSLEAVPDSPAVHAWDGSLTYKELDGLSNKLAAHLIQRGVQKGQYVPFSFEKSMWMVVAVLGILKAGGAIVPIDPSQPHARAQQIVQEVGARTIVTSASQQERLQTLVDEVVSIGANDSLRLGRDTGASTILPKVLHTDPAVVIFTSGSTGNPKGIIIEHGAIATRMIVEGRAFGYHGARTLQFAASTWDIFLTDIFTTLTFQGCICIPNEEDRRFNLSKFCTDYKVSLALITPTLANLLEPATFPTLKTLIFGGEALREDVLEKWSVVKGISLNQGYGPAETGPCITGQAHRRPEVLGYALDNSVCVLVDPQDHNRLVPVGAVGELVVGGPSLLRRYINNPEKTNAAVIGNPEWARELDLPISRFYKTGDLLRYSFDTLDGRLEFVGRTDDQVKYHGQRIELGEIECHLSSLPGLASVMVTLVKSGPLKDKLVAVAQVTQGKSPRVSNGGFSVNKGAGVTIADVRKHLLPRVPEYMIPSELVVLHEMPLNVSLKLDRARISKWLSDTQIDISNAPDPAPKHESNTLLAHELTARQVSRQYALIVAEGNKHRRSELEDTDFNLQSGGIDSVQIISLHSTLKRSFKVKIPIDEILSSKATVRSIAAVIDENNPQHRPSVNINGVEPHSDFTELGLLHSSDSAIIHRTFITGGSGFLGIEILRQLLCDPNRHVYALVRAQSEKAAEERLIRKATEAGWWTDAYKTRLHAWIGDLAQAQLGLNRTQWQMLQGLTTPSIDSVIHNGAKVHYNLDYDSLKPANVSSTVELLNAVNSRKQPLTSFVYVSGGQQLSFNDKDDQENANKAINGTGYSKSKVVSELIINKFSQTHTSKNLLPIKVVRPGYIIGDSERGLANKSDFIWRLISASIEVGSYNADEEDTWLFVSDTSRVSQAIIEALHGQYRQQVAKILDGIRFKDLWKLLKSYGYDLQPLNREQWLARLHQFVAAKQERHVLFPLMYMFESNEPIGVQNGPFQPSTGVKEALEANIRHLITIDFLPKPKLTPYGTSSGNSDTSGSYVDIPRAFWDEAAVQKSDQINVQSVRQQFPALHHGIVPFNNAAGTAVHQEAADKAREYLSAIPIELGHDDVKSQEKTQRLMNNYGELAAFINADPDEIAFGQTTTFMFRALGQALRPNLNSDCEIVVSNLCHEASAAAWIKLAKDVGITIKWWAPPPGDNPVLSLETLKPLLSPKTRVVTCNHVSNVIGNIHPIRQVADLVHAIPGAVLIVDGVAWAPHRPVDVKALDVDFYCFSWYKVFGPHIAQLYGRRSAQKRVLTHSSHYFLSEMPGLDWRLRLGSNTFELEEAIVPIARYLTKLGWDNIIAQEVVLQHAFLEYLNSRPQLFRVFGEKSSDPSKRVSVITFTVIGHSSSDIVKKVCQKGRFRVVAGSCWAPRPTHDVLGLDEEGLIRVSFVHYNTISEVKEFTRELDAILGYA